MNMTYAHRILMALALAPGLAGCGRAQVEPTQTVLVDTADDGSLQRFRSTVSETAFQSFGGSSAVMRLQVSEVAQLSELGVTHFDISAGPLLDVLPLPSPLESALDAGQSALLTTLTEGLEQSQFLVTGERPLALTRDVLVEPDLALGLLLPGQGPIRVLPAQTRTEGELLVWEAELEGGGRARIVSGIEGLSGLVRREGDTYSIASLGGGRHVIIRESPARFLDHPPPAEAPQLPPSKTPGKPPSIPQACADPADKLRVLFAYSETLATSGASIASDITLAISETNDSFKNSLVNLAVVSAGMVPVNYVEDSRLPYQRHHAVMNDRSDKIADGLPSDRDAAKADVVVLLVQGVMANGQIWCGDAAAIRPPAEQAYTVTTLRCATAHLSLAHEIGHLAGARHDDDASTTPYPFGRGHINAANLWRTIMATDRNCAGCRRIPHWSNPMVYYPNKAANSPTGITGVSEEARVWSIEAAKLSRYRCGNGKT